jgi:hypothetical protein
LQTLKHERSSKRAVTEGKRMGWSSGLGVGLRQNISIKKGQKSTNWLGIGYEKMFCDCDNELYFSHEQGSY